MQKIKLSHLEDWYINNHEKRIYGRHLTIEQIEPLMNASSVFNFKSIGQSFLKKSIYATQFGRGKLKVMLWTQMHGNESTGTKAFFDLLNFIEKPSEELTTLRDFILARLEIRAIPMLNPDGAAVYTRVNAQNIDLNRDVLDKKAPESILLQEQLKAFHPQYCFNMHDQRTIFSVTYQNNPATLSFLAPSINPEREVTTGRIKTMAVINGMNQYLQELIPNQIGRYTDEFYPTATGDNFQKMGYNTILVESGHYQNDYNREKVRAYTFYALLTGLYTIALQNEINSEQTLALYESIPRNEQHYTDVLLKQVMIDGETQDIAIQFKEKLNNNRLEFIPEIREISKQSRFSANHTHDLNGKEFDTAKDVITYFQNTLS